MGYKKTVLLIIAITILFCSGFFTAKWINKSKTEEVSDIMKTPINSSSNNQNISPTGVQDVALSDIHAEQTISETEPIAASNLTLVLRNKSEQKAKESISPTSVPTLTAVPTKMPTTGPAAPLPTVNSDETAISASSQTQTSITMLTDETTLISTMHQMTNGLIEAKDGQIWGVIDMTKSKVSELIKNINSNNYIHEHNLLQILEKWIEGDFTQIVDDHNTLWSYLNGNIGEAIRPNEKIKNGKYPGFK